MRLKELADVRLEKLIRHPESVSRVQHLLGQKEAVLTIEITDWSSRFRQQMERWWSLHCQHSVLQGKDVHT
jgi:hypothetical protein